MVVARCCIETALDALTRPCESREHLELPGHEAWQRAGTLHPLRCRSDEVRAAQAKIPSSSATRFSGLYEACQPFSTSALSTSTHLRPSLALCGPQLHHRQHAT